MEFKKLCYQMMAIMWDLQDFNTFYNEIDLNYLTFYWNVGGCLVTNHYHLHHHASSVSSWW